MLPPPPAAFPTFYYRTLKSRQELHRIHDGRFAPTAFNPGIGQSRFAPIHSASGDMVPTLYAASSFECAVHETLFHDVVFDAPLKTVPFSRLQPIRHSILRVRRDLALVSLFAPDLNAWSITRADLIDTLPSAYASTARWAEAIHAARSDGSGLVWTSRRCDPDLGFMLFGDRAGQDSLELISSIAISASDAEMLAIAGFARRAGIVLTL
jgi:hypothetical protein